MVDSVDALRTEMQANDSALGARIDSTENSIDTLFSQDGNEVLNRTAADNVLQGLISTHIQNLLDSKQEELQRYLDFQSEQNLNSEAVRDYVTQMRASVVAEVNALTDLLTTNMQANDTRYNKLKDDVARYLTILSDIKIDSNQIRIDNGELRAGAWTILSQARAWDLDILKRLNQVEAGVGTSLADAVEELQNSVPSTEETISRAIAALSEATIITELDSLIASGMAATDALTLRINQVTQDIIISRNEVLASVGTSIASLTKDLNNEVEERINEIAREAATRVEQFNVLNIELESLSDGFTSQIAQLAEDNAETLSALNAYKVSNDTALAGLISKVNINVADTAANAANISSLTARVGTNESNIATVGNLAQSAVDTNSAQAVQLTSLTARVTTVEGVVSTKLDASVISQYSTTTEMNSAIASGFTQYSASLQEDIAANSDAIASVSTRVTAVEGSVASNSTSITSLQNSVSGINTTLATKADSSAVTSLASRVTANETTIASQSSNLTKLNNTLGVAPSITINAVNTDLIYYNNGEVSIVSDGTAQGGQVIHLGNNTNNDEIWLHAATMMVFDPSRLYKVRARFRRVSGSGIAYLGLACMNSDKSKYVTWNNVLSNDIGSSHYFTFGTYDLGVWQTVECYVKGKNVDAGDDITLGSLANPKKLAEQVAHISPMFIANYTNQSGECEIDYITLEVADDLGANYLNSVAITALDSRTTAVEGTITSQGSAITSLQNSVTSLNNNKADSSALTALTNRVTATEGNITSIANQITSLSSVVDTNNANLVNNYYTKAQADSAMSGQLSTYTSSTLNPAIAAAKDNKTVTVDLRSLDVNTYYPVTWTIEGTPQSMSVNCKLRQYLDNVVWSNHDSKTFSVNLEWQETGSGWGAQEAERRINGFGFAWCGQSPVLGPGQLIRSSTSFVYLRGGARYTISCPQSANPTIRTSAYTVYDESVNPIPFTATLLPVTNNTAHSLAITEHTVSINGIKGVKTVTIDNNGVLSGYGLVSELVNGVVTSAFGVNADYFYVGSPASGKKPFIIKTVPTNVNGVTYPAGTWIDTAFIATASIGSAQIAELDAAKITSGFIDANRIGANTITADKLIVGDTTNLWVNQYFNQNGPKLHSTYGRTQWNGGIPEIKSRMGLQLWGRDHIAPYSTKIPLKAGDTFTVEYVAGQNAGPVRALGVGLWVFDGDGSGGTSPFQYGTATIIADLGGGWFRWRRTFQVWDNGSGKPAAYGCLYFQIEQAEADANPSYWTVGDIVLRRALGGELIVNGAINANHINVTSLSAISANLGTLVTYKDPTQPLKARMVMQGSLIQVYDNNNKLRVRLGLW